MTLSPSSRSMYAQPAATIYGHLPVFQHEEQDVRSFRMFTSQMIGSGTVEPKRDGEDIWRADDRGEAVFEVVPGARVQGFYEANPRNSSASALKREVLERAQQLLDEGRSVPEVVAGRILVAAVGRHPPCCPATL
jgi:hypothetical protein